MNRRHFIKCGMAAGVAIALGRKVARAASYTDQRYWVGRIPQIGDPHPPIDVTGKPTPDWLHKGEPGESYFRAAKYNPQPGQHAYLNSVDINRCASECDIEGGWVRMYAIGGDDSYQLTVIPSNDPRCQNRYAYYDNWTKEIPPGHDVAPVERIHFGKVEIK